jgi:predicted enzyme related to lactoylglutathione lyase
MATIDKHPPGSFCWVELGTTDQQAAKSFYQTLFNWSVNDFPMGPGQFYSMFQLGGRDSAAAYTLNPQMMSEGVRPHWMLYLATADADETASKAAQSGGKVMAAPFDVADFGRMAVIQDPAGATFSIWQPKSHTGLRVNNEPGAFCWADLNTPDQAAAARFYAAVFGWSLDPGQDGSGYLHIKNGDQYIGGILPAAHHDPNVPPHWLLYFAVQDCDASTAKAKELGARVYMGPMTMENVGRMTDLADPQGAIFALFQPMPRK